MKSSAPLPAIEDTELVLQELFRHTPVGVLLSDLHGTIIDVNDALCAMLGYDRADLIGHAVSALSHPDDQADVQSRTADLREGRTGHYAVQRRYLSRGGEVVHAKVSMSIVYSKTHEPVCGIGFVENITDRVVMETALRESELRYRRVVEDQTELIVRCLPDGKRTFVNQAYCRYNNATAEELLGTSIFTSMNDDTQRLVRAKFAALTPSNPVLTDQHRVDTPGGAVRWHEWTDRGFFDDAGTLIEIQSIGRDLTEQHEAQERLVESEERYRRLFNTLPIAVWENDWSEVKAELERRGLTSAEKMVEAVANNAALYSELGATVRVTTANPAALAMAGVTNLPDFDAWLAVSATPETELRFSAIVPPLIFEDRQSAIDEYTLIGAHGDPIEVLIHIARSEDRTGRCSLLTIAVDVTARSRAEEEAARYRDELVRADKMISLGILVSGMAHEINNPNHAIGLNVPLVRDAWRDATPLLDELASQRELRIGRMPWTEARGEVAAMLEDIEHASDRIRNIVNELRAFALDQEPGERQNVSVNDIVDASLRLLGKHIARATKHFELALADDVPLISAIPQRLEQVVVNLVLNACQALENDEQAIRLATGFDGRRVFIRVRDEGRGIAPEHLANLRTPFFTTKRAEGGTGLGVPVSDRIAGEHGGELTFESELGRGTTATLWLPPAGS